MCFYDALTFNGVGYRGGDFVLGFSYWPDFWARVFLGYLVYDLVAMLAIRCASESHKPAQSVALSPRAFRYSCWQLQSRQLFSASPKLEPLHFDNQPLGGAGRCGIRRGCCTTCSSWR